MALYGRKAYDEELEALEMESQSLSGQVLFGQITGLQCLKLTAAIELRKRQAKGKLLRTMSILQDAKTAVRCDVAGHAKGCVCGKVKKARESTVDDLLKNEIEQLKAYLKQKEAA